MKRIDEARLESDLGYRFGYVAEFMGFGPDDVAAIHGAAPHLAPVVPQLVEAVYEKLFGYDSTKRHFVPKQSGYSGEVPDGLDALSRSHGDVSFGRTRAWLDRLGGLSVRRTSVRPSDR